MNLLMDFIREITSAQVQRSSGMMIEWHGSMARDSCSGSVNEKCETDRTLFFIYTLAKTCIDDKSPSPLFAAYDMHTGSGSIIKIFLGHYARNLTCSSVCVRNAKRK